jgi:hypothetical protein
MNTINAIIYHRPNGRKEEIIIKNIYKKDAKFINDNNIKVSMEKISENNYAIYFNYGKKDNENEPIEHIELSLNRSCELTIESAINKLRNLI